MPGAVALPLLIGAGVSAGTQIAGAKMASNAAKNAAKTQANSANQALQYQERALGPYANAGQSAVTTLGRLLTPGQPYTPQMQAQDAARPGTFGSFAAPPMQAGGGGMVQLRAPSGEIQAVPEQYVPAFLAKGAMRV